MNDIGTIFTDTLRSHHRVHHIICESFGLYRGQHRLFFSLHGETAMAQKKLAERMNISASTLTRMVQNLEKKGYVFRHTDEKDQRKTLIALTQKGNAVHDIIHDRMMALDKIIFERFSAEEQETLKNYLLHIQDQLNKEIITLSKGDHRNR